MTSKPTHQVWSEEYRPAKLKDIIGQPSVSIFQAFVREKNVVDCTLSGVPGIGKTTAVRALFYELYAGTDSNGVPYHEVNTTIMNASDENSINDVRGKVKEFTTYPSTHPDVPFRVIFLDEADKISQSAQDALRGIIEENSKNCRFILSCNNPNGLTEALQSRNVLIPFFKLSETDLLTILTSTCLQHSVTITEDAARTLIHSSNGDLRSMLKRLQIAAMLNPAITSETLAKFINTVNDTTTEKILQFAFAKDFASARSLLIELYATSHYDAHALLASIERTITKLEPTFPNPMTFWKICSKIGEASINISHSQQPLYVLIALISDTILITSIPIHCQQIKEG